MAIAGKVAITPKGAWSSTASYKKLDAVTHNNALYIAKKDSVGVEPVDGDTWMFAVTSLDQEQFDEAITKLNDDLEQVQSSLSKPGIYEILPYSDFDLRTETSQSFSLSDNPGSYDLVYAEFRDSGSSAYHLYDTFIGLADIFGTSGNHIDINCGGSKYTLEVSFDSSTNRITFSNNDGTLDMTIKICGIKVNSK